MQSTVQKWCAVCLIAVLVFLVFFRCSNPVKEKPQKPNVSLVADTTVSIRDTCFFSAHNQNSQAEAVSFSWLLDGVSLDSATAPDSVCVLVFGAADTGRHRLVVSGFGNGLSSDPETSLITVLLNPPVITSLTHDTVLSANDSIVLRTAATDRNGFVKSFQWSIDSPGFTAITDSPWLDTGWGTAAGPHVVRVRAMDDDGVFSPAESMTVTVVVSPPRITLTSDTSVAINDSFVVRAIRTDTFTTTVLYMWTVDQTAIRDTTQSGFHGFVFGRLMTGKQVIRVRAIDSHRLVSNADSVTVHVHGFAPTVSIVHDTAVAINDTMLLRAAGFDTNGVITRYLWAVDGRNFRDTTRAGMLATVWRRSAAGTVVVKVKAVDDDTLESNVDSVRISVLMKPPPTVTIAGDTSVFINARLVLHARAAMSASKSPVTAYLWNREGKGFGDTTRGDSIILQYAKADTGAHLVIVKVVDRDTMVSVPDTAVVHVKSGAPVVTAMKDTVVYINDTVRMRAAGFDTNGVIKRYLWALDGKNFRDTTAAGLLATVWHRSAVGTVVVRVKALDDDTLESNVDSVRISVVLKPLPTVMITGDTSVFIKTDLVLHAQGAMSSSTSPLAAYVWDRDQKGTSDTTSGDSITLRYARPDTGRHLVIVKVVDRDTMVSAPDTVVVHVRSGVPVVAAMKDTVVYINDTVLVHAAASDTNGTIAAFVWSRDGAGFTDTTTTGVLPIVWTKANAGVHVIRVAALDNDTLVSRPDSVKVTVRLGMPVVVAQNDTAVFWGDTVLARVSGRDTNGSIIAYYWHNNVGDTLWTDTTSLPTLPITRDYHTVLPVVVGVIDDDGLIGLDTFVITFKTRACSVKVSLPHSGDTVAVTSWHLPKSRVNCAFSALRADMKPDTFSFSVYAGTSKSSLEWVYTGSDSVGTVGMLDTGKNYWKVVAVDSHNDTAVSAVDSLYGVLQRRICFIGHSIIAGTGGAPDSGGFRRMVIDSLRSNETAQKKLGCIGPLQTGLLKPAPDDSCLAVVGSTAFAMWDSLVLSEVGADVWVYMIGVNEGYSDVGKFYTKETLIYMHNRNPHGEMYVLNGLPFPHDTVQGSITIDSTVRSSLSAYNRYLDSVVTAYRQVWQGGVWLVNAFAPMALADSTRNPAYFTDLLHPNQKGYGELGREILKTIRTNGSPYKK